MARWFTAVTVPANPVSSMASEKLSFVGLIKRTTMVSAGPRLPAMSCAKARTVLVPGGSRSWPAQLVVPMTAIGGSVLTCRKTWLIPVSSSRGSLAVPANATALVVKSDSLAGLMMVVTGPLVSGNLPGATRRRMSPTPFVSIPAIAMR